MTPPLTLNRLKARIDGEVRTDDLYRHMLSTDGSIFRKIPAGVVYPKHTRDVIETVRFAREHGLSVHPRGAGSGLCGAALGDGIVLDFSRFMNRLLHMDTGKREFTCEPGYRFGELAAALRGKGLFFPPDPSSGEYASFGGMVATNASGAHSVKYGNVADYLVDADVVLGDGSRLRLSRIHSCGFEDLPANLRALWELYEKNRTRIETAYPRIACNVAGYNLRGLVTAGRLHLARLFSGAEGTLGIATRLTLRLLDAPAHDALVVAYFDDILRAAKGVQQLLPLRPAGIEIMDKSLLKIAKREDARLRRSIPDGIDNVLLIEFDGEDRGHCQARARETLSLLTRNRLTDRAYAALSREEKEKFWAVRKAAVPILYKLKGEKKILALVEDAAVPTDRLTDYFQGLYAMFRKHSVDFVLYGHIAKGLLHTRPLLNLKDPGDVRKLKRLADEAFELVHGLGGVVSGEHGDGRLRSAFVRRQYPEIYPLFVRTKQLLDPNKVFNPEIITAHDACQMHRNLRYGAAYRAEDTARAHLCWPKEGFVAEVEKCHGCTKCTTVTTATRMCPVYKFTRDEAAAPKAKANLLRALISGAIPDRTLYETGFQQVMDRCANCGSCRVECPSGVDIPKLAMEARARYVGRFGASPHAVLVSNVEPVARMTRKIFRYIAPVVTLPGMKRIGERVTGISRHRPVVPFQPRSLADRIGFKTGDGGPVVLYFAGCFAGYVRPEVGEALVHVLSRMGMTVYMPPQHCCGLPALTKGLVGRAGIYIRKNLRRWAALAARVDHVVVTCSSCGYALMKEWGDLPGGQAVSSIARKTIHVSRLLNRYRHRLEMVARPEKLLYHQPCHLKVQPDAEASLILLKGIPGVEVQNPNTHCCGMMGAWGMAAANHALSRRIGRGLIETLNGAGEATGVTDCPTCRMQMETFSHQPVRHPVEILAARMSEGRGAP